jgi:hypothetical protein
MNDLLTLAAYDDQKNKIAAPLLVGINFGDIAFAER